MAIVGIGLLVISILLYPVPALIGWARGHNNQVAIGMLNLFLGWTFIGWAAAMIWAFTDNVRR